MFLTHSGARLMTSALPEDPSGIRYHMFYPCMQRQPLLMHVNLDLLASRVSSLTSSGLLFRNKGYAACTCMNIHIFACGASIAAGSDDFLKTKTRARLYYGVRTRRDPSSCSSQHVASVKMKIGPSRTMCLRDVLHASIGDFMLYAVQRGYICHIHAGV